MLYLLHTCHVPKVQHTIPMAACHPIPHQMKMFICSAPPPPPPPPPPPLHRHYPGSNPLQGCTTPPCLPDTTASHPTLLQANVRNYYMQFDDVQTQSELDERVRLNAQNAPGFGGPHMMGMGMGMGPPGPGMGRMGMGPPGMGMGMGMGMGPPGMGMGMGMGPPGMGPRPPMGPPGEAAPCCSAV
jgi:hypothetical protein